MFVGGSDDGMLLDPQPDPGLEAASRDDHLLGRLHREQEVDDLGALGLIHGRIKHIQYGLDVVDPTALELPGVPIDRRPQTGAGLVAPRHQGISGGIGGRVGHMAEAAQDGRERRHHDAEIEGAAGQQAIEHHQAEHLGAEVLLELGPAGVEDDAPHIGDAGAVHDAVDPAEATVGRRDHGRHLGLVRYVGGGEHHLGAERLERAHRLEPVRGRRGRAAHQHQPGLAGLGEVAGEDQADFAEAAGDQVDAALAGRPRRRAGGAAIDLGDVEPPGLAAAQRHYGLLRPAGGETRLDPGRELDEVGLGVDRIDVDQPAGDVGDFLGRDPGEGDERRVLGDQRIGAAEIIKAGGHEMDGDGAAVADRGYGLQQAQQPEDVSLLAAPERGLVEGSAGVQPGGLEARHVDDALRHVGAAAPALHQAIERSGARVRDGGDRVSPGAQQVGHGAAEAAVAAHHEDAPRLLLGRDADGAELRPGGRVEPLTGVGALLRRIGCFEIQARVDPVALALERVGRQGHPAALLAPVEARPVHLHPGQPEPPKRRRDAESAVVRIGQHGQDVDGLRLQPALPREGRQAPAWTDLDHDGRALRGQRRAAGREADRFADLPGPEIGVRDLGCAHHGAGQAGDERNGRWLEQHRRRGVTEIGQHRLHRGRMERVRRVQQAGADAGRREVPLVFGHGHARACQDDQTRSVDGRDRHGLGQGGKLPRVGRDRQHRSRRHLAHEPPARRHEPQGVGEGQDPGPARGRIVADAVADHEVRLDAPSLQQVGRRILGDEESELGRLGLAEPAGIAGRGRRREHEALQVRGDCRLQQRQAAVHGRREGRLVPVEIGPHPGILRALAGEHERHPGWGRRRLAGEAARPALAVERHRRVGGVGRDHDAAVIEGAAGGLGREHAVREGQA